MLNRFLFITALLIVTTACAAGTYTAVDLALPPEPSSTSIPPTNILPTDIPATDSPPSTTVPPTATAPPTLAATEEALPSPTPSTPATRLNPTDILLFDFTSRETTGRWYIVNDSVMGGVSQSAASLIEPGVLVFSGTVSLDNNGGFASLRSEPAIYEVANADALRIRVMGDGQIYRLRVRTDNRLDGVAYDQPFATIAGEWTEIILPIADFNPQFRGRILTNQPPLDPAAITSLGIMITDKQEGSFSLLVDWISAVVGGNSAEQIQSDDTYFGKLFAGESQFVTTQGSRPRIKFCTITKHFLAANLVLWNLGGLAAANPPKFHPIS